MSSKRQRDRFEKRENDRGQKRSRGPRPEAQMHPRNRYLQSPPDFFELAAKYPTFAPYVRETKRGEAALDWNDPYAIRALTQVLLKNDFDLEWMMPIDHLCPPVTQRLNYIHWVADLIGSPQPNEGVRGWDIGTGASCIFPLLGTQTYGWSFLASEIDATSVQSAQENVTRNQLDNKIAIRHVEDRKQILTGVITDGDPKFDFCMCNPPFFDSLEQTALNDKRTSNATANELVCPGGEQAFISQMVEESVKIPHRIRWFTSMLGRKASVKSLQQRMFQMGATCVQTTEFAQGKQARWGIAWTFDPAEKKKIADHVKDKAKAPVSGPVFRNKSMFSVRDQEAQTLTDNLHDLMAKFASQHSPPLRLELRQADVSLTKGVFVMTSVEEDHSNTTDQASVIGPAIGPDVPPTSDLNSAVGSASGSQLEQKSEGATKQDEQGDEGDEGEPLFGFELRLLAQAPRVFALSLQYRPVDNSAHDASLSQNAFMSFSQWIEQQLRT